MFSAANQVLMYTAMKSIFADKNKQEDLFFKGPGKDLDVSDTPRVHGDGTARYRRLTLVLCFAF